MRKNATTRVNTDEHYRAILALPPEPAAHPFDDAAPAPPAEREINTPFAIIVEHPDGAIDGRRLALFLKRALRSAGLKCVDFGDPGDVLRRIVSDDAIVDSCKRLKSCQDRRSARGSTPYTPDADPAGNGLGSSEAEVSSHRATGTANSSIDFL